MRRRGKSNGISSTLAIAAVDVEHACASSACCEHGDVEQVLQPGLEVAVQVRVVQHALGLLAADVEMPLQDDAVLRQRAGLVGAQHVHRAEVLDRVEPLDDHLLARHRDRALGEADRHDHRQHFRRQADRHRHREEERLQPVALGQAVDHEDQRHHHQDEADHQPGEAGDALVEGGRHAPPGDLVGELAEEGVRAGAHDDAGRRSR